MEVALLATLALLLFNKILNSQYVLWALPLMALLHVPRSLARLLFYAALTQLAYVYLPLPQLAANFVFLARTAVLIALGFVVFRRSWSTATVAEQSRVHPGRDLAGH